MQESPEQKELKQFAAQQQAAQEQVSEELKRMLIEVKRKLKPESKNELIRIIGALLVDNYGLKMQLQMLTQQDEAVAKDGDAGSLVEGGSNV